MTEKSLGTNRRERQMYFYVRARPPQGVPDFSITLRKNTKKKNKHKIP